MVYRINYCTSVDFNPQDIANTLLALDEMELAVSDLKEVQKMLFETVSRLCAIFSIREILICVEAFDHIYRFLLARFSDRFSITIGECYWMMLF